jgi:uncharacterized protein (TIGR03118 family)
MYTSGIRLGAPWSLAVISIACLGLGCEDDHDRGNTLFEEVELVSDQPGVAARTDPRLVNPWGLAFGPDTAFWVANNETATATVYDANGVAQPTSDPLVVDIPPKGSAAPTGEVFNGTDEFVIAAGTKRGASRFLFASEDGSITGWNPDVSEAIAVVAVPPSDAIYKGLALAVQESDEGARLYATDFAGGRVDVFDGDFAPVDLGDQAFVDANLPDGFAPFGIANVNGEIWVTFAKQDEEREDDVPGRGNGVVDVFDANGVLLRRFAGGGELDSPWGIALAPSDFGTFGDAILIGNFGDGLIHAYDPDSGDGLGALESAQGVPIRIDGLWALAFGNGQSAGVTNELYFTAGPNDEEHGLFGVIRQAGANP